ncbi:MFS transporter [Streptomyces sp. NPDC002055]|uniref:MFS transporter n=1 Tax=Streptomyces sp. NPDC002055 TaxID=3154534 RepID=UPI00331716DF
MTTTELTVAAEVRAERAGQRRVMTALTVVVLSYGLMQTMLVPTTHVLRHALDTSAAGASWAVLSAPLLASAVVTPLVGRLADRHGTRRVLLGSLAIHLLGTLGAAVAPNAGMLITCRAVQGISLALLPLSFAIIREALPPDRVPAALAVTSGLVGGTAGAGLLVGGLMTDHASWRWLFVIGALLVAAALVLAALWVPAGSGQDAGRLDLPGTLVLAAGSATLLLGITQGPAWGWSSPTAIGTFVAAAVLMTVFTLIERRVPHPVVDLRVLTHRPLLTAHLGALALGTNQFVIYVLVPELAQLPEAPGGAPAGAAHGFGASVTGAALLLLPGTVLSLPASWLAPRLERHLTIRGPLALGLGLAAAGGLLLAVFHAGPVDVLVCYLVCSAGHGLAMAALPRLVQHATPPARSGSANSVNTVARTFGGAIGSQAGTAVIASLAVPGTGLATSAGFTTAFGVAAAVAALGSLLPLAGRAA